MNVDLVDVDDLRPYHRNPRDHEESVPDLVESIRQFGFKVPIIVDEDNSIITGHGRFKAVQRLEGTLEDRIEALRGEGKGELAGNLERVNEGQVYAVREGELSDKEKREFRISDNKVQDATTWLEDELKFELRELEGAVGFSDEELEDLLDVDMPTGLIDDDAEGVGSLPDGTVEEVEERLEGHYEGLSDSRREAKVDVTCPECYHQFKLDRNEFERAADRAATDGGEE